MPDRGTCSPFSVKILIAEDEPGQREMVAFNLKAEGWTICQARDGEEALLMAGEFRPDAIVLSWMLPKISGVDVCRALKRRPQFRSVPIIMLVACVGEHEQVRRLDGVADDCVTKPYTIAELSSRIRANLRRLRPTAMGDVLTFDDITLDSEAHRVRLRGEPVRLGPTDFRLLAILIERPGTVWSRKALLDRVWGERLDVETRTVDVHIGRLRRALGQKDADYPIRTVRGAGYTLG